MESGLEKYHRTNTFLSDALTLEANDQIDKAVAEKSLSSYIWLIMLFMLHLRQTSGLSETIQILISPTRKRLLPH